MNWDSAGASEPGVREYFLYKIVFFTFFTFFLKVPKKLFSICSYCKSTESNAVAKTGEQKFELTADLSDQAHPL